MEEAETGTRTGNIFLHVGRCPAQKLLIEPDSRRINNIRGSAHTCTPNKGEDKVVKVRAITRQIQIKDIVFNLQDTKMFFESAQCWGEEEGKERGKRAVSSAQTFLMVSVTFCGENHSREKQERILKLTEKDLLKGALLSVKLSMGPEKAP